MPWWCKGGARQRSYVMPRGFPRALGPRKQGARDPGSEEPGTHIHCVTDYSLGQPAGYTGPKNQDIQKRFRLFALVVQAVGGVNVTPVSAAMWGLRAQGPRAQGAKNRGTL